MRNNRTSPYLWGFTLLTVVPAVLFWNNTWLLMGFCCLFVISYVSAYLAIVRFKGAFLATPLKAFFGAAVGYLVSVVQACVRCLTRS